MEFQKVKISDFLIERPDRYKPFEANDLGLKRLNKIDFSGNIHLSDKLTNTNMILIKHGDLVISGINIEKGALAIYQGDEDIIATIHYSSYEFDKSKINVEYFKWFLKSAVFKEIVNSQIGGGIKTELKAKKFLPLKISLPLIKDQENILKKINSIKNEIKELENENDLSLIKKLRQSILSDAVSGKLVSQDTNDESAEILLEKIKRGKEKLIREKKIKKEKPSSKIEESEIPYELPKGWVWCRLGNISKLITDGTHLTPNYSEKGMPFLSAKNVKPFKFMPEIYRCVSKEDYNKYVTNKKAELRDVLLTRVGAGIGEAAVIDKDIDFAIYVSIALIKMFNNYIDTNYLTIWLNSPIGRAHSTTNTLGIGHSQGNLNLTLIRNFPFSLPPFPEQKRIVAKVDELMKLCDLLEKKMKENEKDSEKLMDSVLREVFKN